MERKGEGGRIGHWYPQAFPRMCGEDQMTSELKDLFYILQIRLSPSFSSPAASLPDLAL